MVRWIAVDVAVGAAAFLLVGAVLLLQNVSMRAVEILLIVFPAIVFPLGALIRRSWIAIVIWCILAFGAIAYLTNAPLMSLALPTVACIAACVIAAVVPRAAGAAVIAAAVAALFIAEPAIWNGMLSRRLHSAAPDVTLTMRDGERFRLDQLHGNVVVLNFWGVWCGPCVREMPELEDVARSGRARFVAVNSGIGGETAAQIDAFLRQKKISIPVALDLDRSVYKAFRIAALPTTVVIDRDGVVRFERIGFASTANYASWLRRSIDAAAR